MEKLSKTIQLGVIILALQLLVHLKFPIPRLVRAVAHRLGVSRKSGYQGARRVLEILQDPERNHPDDSLGREVLHLRIQNQVLTYEREHPEVRFADRLRHLPEEAKSLCVRIFRDFQDKLPKSEIAQILGVSSAGIRRPPTAAGSLRKKSAGASTATPVPTMSSESLLNSKASSRT